MRWLIGVAAALLIVAGLLIVGTVAIAGEVMRTEWYRETSASTLAVQVGTGQSAWTA